MAGTEQRTAPGYPTDPGRPAAWTCGRCGRALPNQWLQDALGERYCPDHQDDPPCRLCAAPVPAAPPGDPGYCAGCRRSAVRTTADMRAVLPAVRADLRAMGIRLTVPVRIRLADPVQFAMLAPGCHGASGVTLFTGDVVERIVILAGQPLVNFGATVAHESMHAWLRQRGFVNTPLPVEEGLCQLAAYEWLRRQPDPRARIAEEQIATWTDPVYGDGFRAARDALAGRGMRALLAHVRTHGNLP